MGPRAPSVLRADAVCRMILTAMPVQRTECPHDARIPELRRAGPAKRGRSRLVPQEVPASGSRPLAGTSCTARSGTPACAHHLAAEDRTAS